MHVCSCMNIGIRHAHMLMSICMQTCVVRAWDCHSPLLYCPAMNDLMWDHPLTTTHVSTLDTFGYIQVPPVSKVLACGDKGQPVCVQIDHLL